MSETQPRSHRDLYVLSGEGDTCVVINWSDLVPQFYLDLKYTPVRNAGHFLMREAPDVFNREVAAFLRSLGPRRACAPPG